MNKAYLIEEIEAYAVAKASGNLLLERRQGGVLQALLKKLPEEIQENVLVSEPKIE